MTGVFIENKSFETTSSNMKSKSALAPDSQLAGRIAALVRRYRTRCLWFIREDFVPDTAESALRILGYIERYGDREAWNQVKELRRCLSANSRSKSAA